MKETSGISLDNAAVAATPKHLLQFAVDQRYDDYTPVDHAVWRFIMRQNTFFLKEYAHKVYFQGLLDTGISFERIPRIQEMNDILAKIEWGAVAVDGFIPPAAFMEFQAYKVLVIACDMRQIHHIEYTPAPDIVHEAAGHAPIIVDREYSKYLQRFGEVGAKAMSSKRDFELYQAIRHLSILKEQPNGDPKKLSANLQRWRCCHDCTGGRSSTDSSARRRIRKFTAQVCFHRSANRSPVWNHT
jgi:phenylalanine-4-hydroxylase